MNPEVSLDIILHSLGSALNKLRLCNMDDVVLCCFKQLFIHFMYKHGKSFNDYFHKPHQFFAFENNNNAH